MLAISLTIGIVFGIKNRKKKSTKDFLLGGGDLKVLPVGFSILAGFISAIAILGFSGEMYKYGTMYWMIILSYFTSHLLIAIVYIPFYHQLNITSAYEVKNRTSFFLRYSIFNFFIQYLELRFHPILRSCCSIIFFLQMVRIRQKLYSLINYKNLFDLNLNLILVSVYGSGIIHTSPCNRTRLLLLTLFFLLFFIF